MKVVGAAVVVLPTANSSQTTSTSSIGRPCVLRIRQQAGRAGGAVPGGGPGRGWCSGLQQTGLSRQQPPSRGTHGSITALHRHREDPNTDQSRVL